MTAARMALLTLALFAQAAPIAAAPRGYQTYGTSSYYCQYPQSYGYSTVSYSAWAYWPYPGSSYFYRVRYVYNGSQRSTEDDGWLYTYGPTGYYQYQKIADYLAKPALALQPTAKLEYFGSTQYGVDGAQYAIAKHYGPKIAALLNQQGVPSPVDVASLLPPATTSSLAIVESVGKQGNSALQLMAQVHSAELANERENNSARKQLALQLGAFQATERIIGQVKEMAAVAQQQAQISATAYAQQISIEDQQLAGVIGQNCFRCHGGPEGVKGGLDSREAARFDKETWKACFRQVLSGKMPKGGQPLSDEQQDLFEDQYNRSRAAGKLQ